MPGEVLDAKMTLENSGFLSAMNRARESTSRATEIFKTAALGITGLGGAFAAFRSAEGIVEGVMGQFEKGRQLMDLSRQTTASVKDLVVLQQAFRDAGASADGVGHTVFMLQKSLGGMNEEGQPTATVFNHLGLSIANLKKLDTVGQFQAIAKGLSAIRDPSRQAAEAMGIFGRSAVDVLGILRDPQAFANATKEMGPMAALAARTAGQFEEVSKSMELMKMKVNSIFTGIAAGLAPSLQSVLDLVNKIDFTRWGEEIGNVIGTLGAAFKDGKITELLKLSLIIGFKEATNEFIGIWQSVMQGLGAGIGAIFSTDFFAGIKSGFIGVAEAFGAALIENLKGPINDLLSVANYGPQRAAARQSLTGDAQNITQARRASQAADDAYSSAKANNLPEADLEKAKQTAISGHLAVAAAAKQASDHLSILGTSMSDYVAAHHNDNLTLGGLDPAGLRADSAKNLADATAKIKVTASAALQSFQDIKKNFKASTTFDASAETAQRTALIASLSAQGKAAAANSAQPPDTADAPSARSLAYKMPEGDRLAKIGLFIGGSPTTAGLSEAKRTAAATEKTSRSMDSLIQITQSLSHRPTGAAFAE